MRHSALTPLRNSGGGWMPCSSDVQVPGTHTWNASRKDSRPGGGSKETYGASSRRSRKRTGTRISTRTDVDLRRA
jgi:hypothetical protein